MAKQESRCKVRILWRGKFSANTITPDVQGVGELAPLSQPMRASDDHLLLFVLQATQ